MIHSTFTGNHSAITRPSILVRIAKLGRFDGAEHTLIGALTDASGGEASIEYGLATQPEIVSIESKLGQTLDQVFDGGVWIAASVCTVPVGRYDAKHFLSGLSPLEKFETFRHNKADHFKGAAGIYADGPEAHKAREQAREADFNDLFARLRASYETTLQLRKKWNVLEMQHRGDWGWLPEFACELVRENSRTWLELPNPPTPPIQREQSVSPEAARSVFQKMRAAAGLA